MKIVTVKNINEFNDLKISNRAQEAIDEKMDYVREILKKIRNEKDRAVIECTKEFDGIEIKKEELKVTEYEIEEAFEKVEKNFIDAVKYAIRNLEKFHKLQIPKDYDVEVDKGISLGRRWSPIDSVGLYIPGGRAPYVTACYMLGIPAKVAGCKNIIACVPPDSRTGKINPYVLVAASLSGITSIYKVGGAQAIGAMAYGTETIPKVCKILGPGNIYVTAAKLLVYGEVDIDAPAGPSEALIIADSSINEKFVAADIISQAEHDVNSAAIFLTTSKEYAQRVSEEIIKQADLLPKKDIIYKSLEKYGAIVVCDDIQKCIEIANIYAPEHIQIMTKNSEEDSKGIVNAGSMCIGEYSPIAMGDYISGVNNVIPTGGAAKAFSPVHVEGYMKCFEVQKITKEGLMNSQEKLKVICNIEGFDAHYNSVEIRLNKKDI